MKDRDLRMKKEEKRTAPGLKGVLKAVLEQAGFQNVQINKNGKGWLCVTARK